MKIPASTSRVRTSFDPELELPKLHQWFTDNPHPSRLTLQLYVKELNSLTSRQSRKLLEVHNLCYWFKNARAAYKRAELRLKRNQEHHHCRSSARNGVSDNLGSNYTPSLKSTSNQSTTLSIGGCTPQVPSKITGSLSPSLTPKRLFYPRTQMMLQGDDTIDITGKGDKLASLREKHHIGMSRLNEQQQQTIGIMRSSSNNKNIKSSSPRPFVAKLNSSNSSDNIVDEGSSRASSTSPSSTISLAPTGSGASSHRQAAPLNNIDLASAVCLLNTATNFTAAAAAAAAVAAASTGLGSGSLPPAANLLQGSSSAVINLAASLINSNLMGAGNQLVAATPSADLARNAAIAANQATTALVSPDAPIRQLLTTFNPPGYQMALGMLDNKVLDTNILNSMTFPIGACAPDIALSRHGFVSSQHNNNHLDSRHHLQPVATIQNGIDSNPNSR